MTRVIFCACMCRDLMNLKRVLFEYNFDRHGSPIYPRESRNKVALRFDSIGLQEGADKVNGSWVWYGTFAAFGPNKIVTAFNS